jgi:TatD DNase family protein
MKPQISPIKLRLFDTHCHFDFQPFNTDYSQHWLKACEAGVERIVIPSIGMSNWEKVIELAASAPQQLFYALGFHPYFLADFANEQVRVLERLLETHCTDSHHKACIAIGECGLDGMVDVPSHIQEEVFVTQLAMAQNCGLPVILHSRKTHSRLLSLLKRHKFTQGGILHAFSGSEQQARDFIRMGFKIGVGGIITYPRANKTRQTVSRLPVEAIVLETDAPDMPLCGLQGQDNHPKYLPRVLQELAQLRDCSMTELAENLWRNSHQVFRLSCE